MIVPLLKVLHAAMKWPSLLLVLLAAFPLSAEPVLVGRYAAKIVPEQLSVFTLPERGVVTDLVAEGRVEAGTVIAVLNKERMEEAREDMEFTLAKERLACRDELRKLEQQRENLVFYLNLSEGERRYAAASLPPDTKPTADSLRDIDERIALVRRELDTMAKRSRDKFEREHESHILRMPFTGRLQYNVTLPNGPGESFELTQVLQDFATACDDSAFYVTILVSRSDIGLLPENKFSVRVALPENRELVGHYARRRVERSSNGSDVLLFFFRLSDEDADTAYKMLGSSATASLYYEVAGEVEHISKASLAAHPAAGECESWTELVERAHPGATVVLVADRDIIIHRRSQTAEQPDSGDKQTEHQPAP